MWKLKVYSSDFEVFEVECYQVYDCCEGESEGRTREDLGGI